MPKGKGYFLHYDVSKAAMLGMSRSPARELGDDKICVNTIAPAPAYFWLPRKAISSPAKPWWSMVRNS